MHAPIMLRLLCLLLSVCQLTLALNNGLALTPPMGWLSWERFRCNIDCTNDPDNCISEKLYMTMADLMVSEGYKDAGYECVNIDDCWSSKSRDSNGKLVPDPDRFPSGIKNLSQYMHARGLKLGIYADFGSSTCGGYPGSEYNLQTDANTFAEWEVDSLKLDGCNSDPKDMPTGYSQMGQYLNQTGRQILYLCQWPLYWIVNGMKPDYAAIRASCNQWRNYIDVQDSWDRVLEIIDYYGQDDGNFSAYAGPGGWNDPDMLVTGDFGLSTYQQKAQFGMWALWASPLMMSVDLRNVDSVAKQLILNKNIIAINQDPLGNQAIKVSEVPNYISVWVKKLSNPKPGSFAIGLLNRDNQGTPTKYQSSFSDLGLTNSNGYQAFEAFENTTIGNFSLSQQFTVYVDPTSIYIIVAVPLP